MQTFRFCGPGDDPDEITGVTLGYRHLLIQLQRSATPLLPEAVATRLNSLIVEPDDLYTAFNANAEIDALTLDIGEAIEAHESKYQGTPEEDGKERQHHARDESGRGGPGEDEEKRNEPVPPSLDEVRQRLATGIAPTFGDPIETKSREVLRRETARLRDAIDHESSRHVGIGHNRPPETMSLPLEIVVEVKEAVSQLDEETARLVPDLDAVVESTGRLERVLTWLARKLDLSVDSFMNVLGKFAAAGVVAGLAVVPIVKLFATVHQAVLEWLGAVLSPF